MNITEFVSEPKVKMLCIDDPEIVEKYGSPIDFYIKFPFRLEEYATLSKLPVAEFLSKVLIDKEGNQLLKEGQALDLFLIKPVHDKIWIEVGKLPEKC